MASEKISIGNVDFDRDSILVSREVYEKGQKLNYVFLVGGTKIMFPDQEKKNAAVSFASGYNKDASEVCAWFDNIKGLIIEEVQQNWNYRIREV